MKNKIIFLVTLVAVITTFVSCNKEFDDLKPHNALTQEVLLSTKNGIMQVTSANYANFACGLASQAGSQTYGSSGTFGLGILETILYMNEGMSNNVNGSELGIEYASPVFYYQTGARNNSIASYHWQLCYAMIRNCNNVIDAIEKQPEKETDPALKQYKGDNLFIRAYVYYNLAQIFCRSYYDNPTTNMGLPLKLTADNSVVTDRGTVKEVYDQIVADLNAAIAVLPENVKPDRNLANKYACYGLLSRVYRDMGGSFSQPNNTNNQLAVDNATKILSGAWGGYVPNADKTDDYIKSMFGINPSKNNTEYLWCFDPTIMTSNMGNIVNLTYEADGSSWFCAGDGFSLSPDLLNLFDKDNDRRYKYFVIPDPFSYYHSPPWDNNFTCGKFITGSFGTHFFGDPTPNPQIRIGEIYLNRAEAYVKLGNSAEALADLNYIRERAGLEPLTGLSGQALFDEILNERRRELFAESLTGLDYYRNGLPMTRNYSSGFPDKDIKTIEPTDYRVIYPIPEFEVNVTGVKQNPGY